METAMNRETIRLEAFRALLSERRGMSVAEICEAIPTIEEAIFRPSDSDAPPRDNRHKDR